MFQLDDKFLQDLGLDQLPEEQRQAFLQHIYEELELRVGTQLSDGMSDAQLEEFESIIDKKEDIIAGWLAANAPDYYNDPAFQRLQQATGLDVNDQNLRDEFVATKWLEVNRPDYRDVVSRVLEGLKQEIMGNREAILSSL
jgi:hypothetical protein